MLLATLFPLGGSVRAFDMFTAEAKRAGFSIIKYVLRPRRNAKIIPSLSA